MHRRSSRLIMRLTFALHRLSDAMTPASRKQRSWAGYNKCVGSALIYIITKEWKVCVCLLILYALHKSCIRSTHCRPWRHSLLPLQRQSHSMTTKCVVMQQITRWSPFQHLPNCRHCYNGKLSLKFSVISYCHTKWIPEGNIVSGKRCIVSLR